MTRLFVYPLCGERVHADDTPVAKRHWMVCWPSLASAAVAALGITLTLQGCSHSRACKISDIYGLIQVDGRTGLSKHQLEKAGIKLCARHLRHEETYVDDACVSPEKVFVNGELPTNANGDVNALLLVRCPSSAYPKGKELQRVTCSDDFMGENDEGDIEKALHLRFDNYERASNCLLGENTTLDMDSNGTLMPEDRQAEIDNEVFVAANSAKAHKHAATLGPISFASSLGPAVLGKASMVRGNTDASIHPHGMISVQKLHHARPLRRLSEGTEAAQEASPPIIRSTSEDST